MTNICQRLDGIALAIELAAARMVSMNPQELLTRLTDRFRLLSSSRHGLERHQTLRLAVQWSYDLLAKDERTLLGRCAVFAGGFDLASAAHICGGDDFDEYAVLDLLDSLVRKSLVTTDQVEGRTRYRLLETIRQFADEQLAATGEIEPVRGRHARYFAELAIVHWNIWDGPRQREAIDWCNAEFANLRAGFRWAVDRAALDTAAAIAAHTSMIVWVANLFEPAAWAEEILKAATAADLRQLPRLYAAAVYVLYTGRPEAAVNYAQTALRLTADARYDAFDPAWTEIRIASAQNATGADADTVLPVCTTLAARFGVARVLGITWMPQWLIDSGRDDEARAMAEEALDAAKTHGNPFVIAIALLNYGRAFAETDPDRAMSKLRQGLGYTHEHRTSFIEALTLENMAAVEGRLGNLHEALALFDSAIESFQRAGNLLALGNTLVVLAEFFRGGLQQLETASTILGGSRANAKWTRELPAVQERLRGVLGAQRFDECFAVGAAMEPAAALRYVRQQIQIARAKLFTVA